ncbi:hypothetical protein [Duganella vulcania]|uniref:Uncharacterized protein n=1 Tax=Duganella vulcania TaxID=2692166 RepID=A0A845GID2_9BURK|nr:hypothetical protein [Duganella vulcania]MYM92527.1 hypothetical protein [Duganella vulcania]
MKVRVSNRIIVTQAVLSLLFLLLAAGLEALLLRWQGQPDTLEDMLCRIVRPMGLVLVPLSGMAQAFLTLTDPLAWRVVRTLRHKSQ